MVLLETPRRNYFFTRFHSFYSYSWTWLFPESGLPFTPRTKRALGWRTRSHFWDNSNIAPILWLLSLSWQKSHPIPVFSLLLSDYFMAPLFDYFYMLSYILWPRSSIFVSMSTKTTYSEASSWASVLGGDGGWEVRVGRTWRARHLLWSTPFPGWFCPSPQSYRFFPGNLSSDLFPPKSLFLSFTYGVITALSCIYSV